MLELSRRNLLIASAVTGAVLAGGVRAAVAEITESPLYAPHDKTLVLTCHPRLQLTRRTYEEGVPVTSIVNAENLTFALANDLHLDNIMDSSLDIEKKRRVVFELFDSRADPDKMFAHIIRACNRIGYLSKRGFGNHVLMHPDMLMKLQTSLGNGSNRIIVDMEPTTIGRWTRVAATTISPNMHFYTGKSLPPQDIVVFYRNTGINEVVDGPGALIRNTKGQLSLFTPLSMNKIYRFTLPVV